MKGELDLSCRVKVAICTFESLVRWRKRTGRIASQKCSASLITPKDTSYQATTRSYEHHSFERIVRSVTVSKFRGAMQD